MLAIRSTIYRPACQGRPCRAPARMALGRRPVNPHMVKVNSNEEMAGENLAPSYSAAPKENIEQGAVDDVPETVFLEGHGGSNVELALSLALTATLIFAPLTMASIGRRFWVNYKFTNKRVIISYTSPLFKSEIQLLISDITDVRTAPRALGAWGDMVLFTKRGERLELIGMEQYKEIKEHIDRCKYTIRI